MLKIKKAVTLGLTMLSVACASGGNRTVVHEPTGSSIELRVSPMMGMASFGRPVTVTATLVIKNPTEQEYCPQVVFTWVKGTTSVLESDCPVYHEISAEEHNR